MSTLFEAETESPPAPRIDWWSAAVRRLRNVPEGWQWWGLDCLDRTSRAVKVSGAVPLGVFSKGPRKGRLKWPPKDECDHFVLTMNDLEETERLWEAETGKCAECQGDCREVASFRIGERTYRPCSKCKGSGLAAKQAAAANG